MGLKGYILKRTIYSVGLLFFVITLNFFIFQLMPGNPLALFMRPGMKPEQIEQIKETWGFDKPIWEKYIKCVQNLLTWNFGVSLASQAPISNELSARLGNTLILMGSSTVLAIIIGIILGVIAAAKRGGIIDNLLVIGSLVTYSFPSFWMGMLAILIFSIWLGWFPTGHPYPPEWSLKYSNIGGLPPPLFQLQLPVLGIIRIPSLEEIVGRLHHLFLPMMVLTLFQYGGYLLLTRVVLLEALTEDYILTARAKGVKERTILFKHALKNASLPLITNIALSFGFMLSGAILTETVFSWEGLGSWTWRAVILLDYPVLQAMFYIIALCVIVANFLADLIYGLVDPRIKYE